jgi:hypothetical protein
MKMILSMAVFALLLSACTWVELTPAGDTVRIVSANEVEGCKRLGTTTASLRDKILGIERNQERVQRELNTLARNGAADMKGDTVVPISEPDDGKQRFAVYRCFNP